MVAEEKLSRAVALRRELQQATKRRDARNLSRSGLRCLATAARGLGRAGAQRWGLKENAWLVRAAKVERRKRRGVKNGMLLLGRSLCQPLLRKQQQFGNPVPGLFFLTRPASNFLCSAAIKEN